jgi:hypothetical protein
MLVGVCRWYAVILKFLCFFHSVLWAVFLSLWNNIYFGFVFFLSGDSKNPVPKKKFRYVFLFLIQLKMKMWWCLRPYWIEFTVSSYCDVILIWIKKPSNILALCTELSSDNPWVVNSWPPLRCKDVSSCSDPIPSSNPLSVILSHSCTSSSWSLQNISTMMCQRTQNDSLITAALLVYW